MGSAQSSNTAKSIANIANSVSSNTTTTSNQVQSTLNNIKFKKCIIGGDVDLNIAAEFSAKSQQIIDAMQNTNIQNMIAQQMQQEAQSTVGSMGLGVAESSNYTSSYASASNDVINMVKTVSNQASFNDTSIVCDGSTIKGNFNINLSSNTDFWSDQAVKSDQITKIANTITQTVQQKAIAKVEGIGGLLLMIALFIAIIGYSVSKPVGKIIKSFDVAIVIIIFFVLIFVILLMWIRETPPFFSKPVNCLQSGRLTSCIGDDCKNLKNDTISLTNTPLKYMYNIIRSGEDQLNMLEMILYSICNNSDIRFNQGYNGHSCYLWSTQFPSPTDKTIVGDGNKDKWNLDTTFAKYGVPQLPNPLYIPKDSNGKIYIIPDSYIAITNNTLDKSNTPSVCNVQTANGTQDMDAFYKNDSNKLHTLALLNTDGWLNYLNAKDSGLTGNELAKQQLKRKLHARYILTSANRFDNNFYIFDGTSTDVDKQVGEEVTINNQTYITDIDKTIVQKYCYKYIPKNGPLNNDYINGIPVNVGGNITGMIGECNSKSNKLVIFLNNIGNYIIIGLIILIVLISVIVLLKKNKV